MEPDTAVVAGPTQRLVHFMDRTSPVNFVLVADVRGPVDDDLLRGALARLQAHHPLLRVRLSEEGRGLTRSYVFRDDGVPSPELRQAPADALAAGGLTREVEGELARPFDVERGPLFRLAVARGDGGRSRLLLTMHHMIADGASAAIVLRDLLRICGGEPAGERRPLVEAGPSFPGLGRVRALWDLVRFFARAGAHFLTRRPAGRNAPGLNAPAAGRETGIIFHELTEAETAALRARAKAGGATVGGMLSAAVARAVYAESGLERPAHVAVINAVDVRDAAGAGAAERVDLLMSFVVTFHRTGDGRGLVDLARECSAAVKAAVARREAVVPHTLASLLPSVEPGEAVRATVRVADRFATSASVTNVGVVDMAREYGPLALERVTLAPSLGFMGRFACVASTFGGRLSLNFAYVKQVVGPELAARLAARCLADLGDQSRSR
jgi:NRPS condensation-like uncharacterized protein